MSVLLFVVCGMAFGCLMGVVNRTGFRLSLLQILAWGITGWGLGFLANSEVLAAVL